jgi:NADH-ubiquinone oxidoreductase chain 1
LFFCISSIIVFSVLIAGWSSNSKYSLIGSLRSVAQSSSYEYVFSTILLIILVIISSYSIRSFMTESSLLFLLFFPLWVICTLAETHRAPFDFSESESELVSGFNTEYSGAYFAFIFLSEYAILIYSCLLITYIFIIWLIPLNFIVITVITLFISFLFIWIRVTYCRFRYDILIIISWKILLPFSLLLFISILIIII